MQFQTENASTSINVFPCVNRLTVELAAPINILAVVLDAQSNWQWSLLYSHTGSGVRCTATLAVGLDAQPHWQWGWIHSHTGIGVGYTATMAVVLAAQPHWQLG